jgi:MoxR-like ATPase
VKQVFVHDEIRNYIIRLVRATRSHAELAMGASRRASLALFHAAQAGSALRGWDYVLPDVVKLLAPYILEHRIIVKPEARLNQRSGAAIIWELVESLPAPTLKGSECATSSSELSV